MNFKWKKFGQHLRTYREDNKFGLRQCSRGNAITAATWSRAENGKPIEVPTFIYLCEWMNSNPLQYASRKCTKPLPSDQRQPETK